MGAWGTALFSDDTAVDVRDRFKELLGQGMAGPEATDRLLADFQQRIDDTADDPVFWLALAATQWKLGRLEDRIQRCALDVIDRKLDLERWEGDPKGLEKRRRVLTELREQLLSPQPAARKIRPPFRDVCEWDTGAFVGYRLQSGRLVIFQVVGEDPHEFGVSPIFVLLDWVGDDVPDERTVASLKIQPGELTSRLLFNRLQATYPGWETRPYEANWQLMKELGIVSDSEIGSTDPNLSLVRTERMDKLLFTKQGRSQLEDLARQRGRDLLETPVQFSVRRILSKRDMPKVRVIPLKHRRPPLQLPAQWLPMQWHDLDDALRTLFARE
jgi:hypothetical protein